MTAKAYSIDGRTFAFEAPLSAAMPIGSYVVLTTDAGHRILGQLLREEVRSSNAGGQEPTIAGGGTLITPLDAAGSADLDRAAAFGAATLQLAETDAVAAHLTSALGRSVGLELGHMQRLADVPARLHAGGFGRHTFLCGQSGSGKTYTLGLILERLLLDTTLKMTVIDPNSDYVNLSSLRPQADIGLSDDEYSSVAPRYASVASKVHTFGGDGSPRRLRARFGRLSFQQQTMVLGLDPLRDAEEFNAFVRAVRRLDDDYTLNDVMAVVRSSFDDDLRRLGLRIENLGIAHQSIWAGAQEPIMDAVPDDWRMLIADLGTLSSFAESSIAAAALLGRIWDQRHGREPMLVVIDEAHNVCPQVPDDANQALATEHVIRIAGEGRKYGLYLLLSTQRPAKVHQNVLSQCDNLLLMRMNSVTDIQSLSQTFSYAPRGLVEQAASFGLGEGLAAGRIAPDPLLFKSGRRLSEEGGSDVPSTWARTI